MYNTIKLSVFLSVLLLLGQTPLADAAQDNSQLADETKMKNEKVYLIVQLTIPDAASYTQQYAIPVVQQLRDIGAKLLAVSPEPQVLEGKSNHKSTVIIEFPSMSVATKWYSSAEYKPYRDIRKNTLTEGGNLILVPGIPH